MNNKLGIKRTCIDCFALGGEIHIYQYGANPLKFLISDRLGSCTLAEAEPKENVVERTLNLFHEGFKHINYRLIDLNCETFAVYCKTRLLVNSEVNIGQIGQLTIIGDIGLRPDAVEMSLVEREQALTSKSFWKDFPKPTMLKLLPPVSSFTNLLKK
ncbi:hypothetical protein L2E82_14997 [Cichorium intybus]|uniref:Uncharacterized protein n=2 Tax=Cichorium intybus TaxID=13427 RepID=A0ACB9F1K5_CICIN|nr:hypothetical protein L2E82_14980 [Cichorium intybus]KAI3764979.1 hypothetical protein L2E82_14997 [Cichorium intybus]